MDKSPEGSDKNKIDTPRLVTPEKDKSNTSIDANTTDFDLDDSINISVDVNITDFNLDDSEIEVGKTDTEKSDPSYKPPPRAKVPAVTGYALRSHVQNPENTGKVLPKVETTTKPTTLPVRRLSFTKTPIPNIDEIQNQGSKIDPTANQVQNQGNDINPPGDELQNQGNDINPPGDEIHNQGNDINPPLQNQGNGIDPPANQQGLQNIVIEQQHPGTDEIMTESNEKLLERYSRILPVLIETPKSLETFIRKADTLYKSLPNDAAKEIFLNCVKDSATESTYDNIALLTTWDNVKRELKAKILPRKTISQLHDELSKVKKDPSDTIVEFADKIKRVANGLKDAHRLSDRTVLEADWKKMFDIIETLSLNTFIQGLSPQLRNWTMARDFKTLRLAEDHARTMEHLDLGNTEPRATTSSDQPRQLQRYQDTTPKTAGLTCYRCNKAGHRALDCHTNIPRVTFSGIPRDTTKRPQGINPIRDNFVRPIGQNQDRPYYRRQEPLLCTHCGGRNHNKNTCFKWRSEVKCTYCGRAGHLIADCLRKIADQPHQRKINHISYGDNPQFSSGQQNYPMVMIPLAHFNGTNNMQNMQGHSQSQTDTIQNGGGYSQSQERSIHNIEGRNTHSMNNSSALTDQIYNNSNNVRAPNQPNNFQILGSSNINEMGADFNLLNLSGNE